MKQMHLIGQDDNFRRKILFALWSNSLKYFESEQLTPISEFSWNQFENWNDYEITS